MKNLCTALFVVFLLVALAGAQQPPAAPTIQTSRLGFPVFGLNAVPVTGANLQIVGAAGQATIFYWAVANYQIGSVITPIGSLTNAPNTLSGGNYVAIYPNYPTAAGVTVDILKTSSALQPSGACGCAVATAQTSGVINDQSNSTSAYTVTVLNPNSFRLWLTNEVTGSGQSHLLLKNEAGVLITDLSSISGGSITGSGTLGNIPIWTSSSTQGNSTMIDTTVAGPPAGGYVTFGHSLFGGNAYAAMLFGNHTGAFTNASSGCAPNTYILCINQTWSTITNTSNATGASIWNTFNGNTISGIGSGTFMNALELHNGQAVSATGAQTMPQQSTLYLQSGVTGYSATLDADLYIQTPVLSVGTTMTHHYGIYIADQTANGSGTNSDPWGMYIVHGKNQMGTGATDTTFFGGLPVPPAAAVASLPACSASTEGAHALATDCVGVCSVGTSCTAGGSTHCELYCNSGAVYKETGLGN